MSPLVKFCLDMGAMCGCGFIQSVISEVQPFSAMGQMVSINVAA